MSDDLSSTDPCARHEKELYASLLYSHDSQLQFWQLCHDGKALCAEILLRGRCGEIDVDLACRDTGRPWCGCSCLAPLLVAANKRRYATIAFLLGHGARVDARDESGRTALHLLSRLGSWWRIDERTEFDRHADVVDLLAGYSESHQLDALDEDGRSPMFHLFRYESGRGGNDYAGKAKRVRRRQLRLLRSLLENGADATIVDGRGWSLLHCVADWRGSLAPYHRNDHYGAAMAQSLCERGARVNRRLGAAAGGGGGGATPLEMAVRNLNYAVARVLVANGAEATELLDYRRYFPVAGTDVVNADTILRTYYMSVATFGKLRAPRIAKMLDFLERPPWIKSVEGFNALIKWAPEDRIRDYFDDVWLALEDEQLPRELDEVAWAALKLPVERAYTTTLLAGFHRSRETDRLFSYMEHILPGFVDVLSGMRMEVENEMSRADSLTLGPNLTLLDFCRRNPAIAHEPEVYEALRAILDDDFERRFPQMREMMKGHIAKNLLHKLRRELARATARARD